MPSEDFFADCVDVRKGVLVVERGQSFVADYRIKLRLCLGLHFGEQDHREEEGVYGRDDLYTGFILSARVRSRG